MSFIKYIPPRSAIDDLFGTSSLSTYDPLFEGFLMSYQRAWVEDKSSLKVASKGRRAGITWAEAWDDVTIAATAKSAGGDDVWYIGDTKDKGREFIKTCQNFALIIADELLESEEFLFDDIEVDEATGEVKTRQITAWRITFASGFRITALSSNPANIRGLQGIVVIDEAAFHQNVAKVIDACVALLIWGGKIRIISTHNGKANPFNQLITEIETGARAGSVHHFPFDLAVTEGLFERVWATKLKARGIPFSPEEKSKWYNDVRRTYGLRTEAMREELDEIPREGEGTMIPLALIEACANSDYKVLRWTKPETKGNKDFVDWSEAERRAQVNAWLRETVLPVLESLPFFTYHLGEDFAMRQDRTSLAIGYLDQRLVRHVPLLIELQNCPYDQQKQVAKFIGDFLRDKRRLGRFHLDANGNGMVLAQEIRQHYGEDRVTEQMPNDAWLLRTVTPLFSAAFMDRAIMIPADLDVRNDLHQFRMISGVGRIPTDVRSEGTDGGRRHADSAVALLNFYAATLGVVVHYGWTSVISEQTDAMQHHDDADDDAAVGRALFDDGAF